MVQNVLDMDPVSRFLYGLPSPETKRQWPKRFEVFLDFIGLKGDFNTKAQIFYEKAKNDSEWLTVQLMRFIQFQVQRVANKEISEATIPNYTKATKSFCEMNSININWTLIRKGMPSCRQAANDRPPTIDEIRKMLQYPDRRIKPIVTTMVSSGIRLGAWDYLKWGHIEHIEDGFAKVRVYAGDKEEYTTLITPEAYYALKEWMDYRKEFGENITKDSWVMRDLWRTNSVRYGAKFGLAENPQKFKSSGIRMLLSRALWEQGVRENLKPGQKRHEFKTAHGLRKFYKSRTEQVMKSINIEILMGHTLAGVSNAYYKPTLREILQDYKQAADLLMVNETHVLKEEIRYWKIEAGKIDGIMTQIEEMKKKLGLNL